MIKSPEDVKKMTPEEVLWEVHKAMMKAQNKLMAKKLGLIKSK